MTAYYVYFTEQCKEDAARHGVTRDIEDFVEKLERDQSTRGLDRFPLPYLKKNIGRQGRLLIEEHYIGADIVLCLAQYLIRGSSEYEKFCKNSTGSLKNNKIPVEDVKAFLEERKRQPVATKTILSNIENTYLQSSSTSHQADDGTYLESYDWFERISQSWAKDSLLRYYELVEFGKLSENETVVSHERNPSVKILYRYFPEHRLTFLIAPVDRRNLNDEGELRKRYEDILDPTQLDAEKIVPRSRRAYPAIIACDENTWIQVQNSNEANLALSPEEEKILESLLTLDNDGPKYPLFINGRPGSGKSTILQYLFSERLERYVELNEANVTSCPPLYLTYSGQLLEQARSAVENILRCGAKTLQKGEELTVNTELLNQSFCNFREFLLDQLSSEEREKFSASKYVGFERFRKEWEIQRRSDPANEVRDIGPELAWHAIRTFIKGMRDESGTEVDPKFYETELARGSKSVSDVTFKLIYEKVWKWYQELCAKEEYWDDQDLVRSVLEHSSDKLSRYPAVFCDEAQDFTKIELELIERLSLYSDRQLPDYLAKRVPFAFAGDPFQTLNPTGFNWSAMQASFHDNIARQLDGSGRLEFNFQELSFNYRSSEQIVKLANLIQLLRAVLLDIKGLRPQQCWTHRDIAAPVWFRHDDASCKSKIREQEELVIIIPCQENGEEEYVKNDPFLSAFALQDGQISRNILSPARAKGLEYDRVLLYGFGEEASRRVPELLRYVKNLNSNPPEIEQRLAWEYFLNQFYVAVSRARKRLFIVDSDDARKEFWQFAELKKQSELLEQYNKGKEWKREDVGGIVQGDDTSWSADRDDPLELARQWRDQGLAHRDPYQLSLAKSNFELADKPEEAKICEAKSCEFSGDFIKAGDSFKALRQADDALRCYWAAEDSDAVVDLASHSPETAIDPRVLAANAIERDKNTAAQIDTVLAALERVESLSSPDDPGESADWRWFFKKFIPKVSEAVESSNQESTDWKSSVRRIVVVLDRLGVSRKTYPDLAELHSLTGDWETAIAHWEECSPDRRNEPEWLLRARAEKESYPENIPFLARLNDHVAVLEAWRNDGRGVSEKAPVSQILKSATEMRDLSTIQDLLPGCNDIERILSAIQIGEENVSSSLNGAIPVAIISWLEAGSRWGQIVTFTTNQKTSYRQLDDQLKSLRIGWDQSVVIAAAVRVFARSERLASEKPESQRTISEFLKQHLVVNNNAGKKQQTKIKEVHRLVNIEEVGAAFERAFRLTFALEYYERCFRGGAANRLLSLSPEDANFAKKRWLMCKRRLGEQEGPRSERHLNEAEQKEREWNLSIDGEPEYPDLAPLAALNLPSVQNEQPPDSPQLETTPKELDPSKTQTPRKGGTERAISANVLLTVDDLRLKAEVLMRKQRIVLTREDTEDRVSCGPKNVSSDDVAVKQIKSGSKDNSSVKAWSIEKWNILCEIQPLGSRFIIRLRTDDGGSIIGFEL